MAGLALAIDLLLKQQQQHSHKLPSIASKGLHSFSSLSALSATAAASSAVSFLAPSSSSLFAHYDARYTDPPSLSLPSSLTQAATGMDGLMGMDGSVTRSL